MIKFYLTGSLKGKTRGFSKTITGDYRFNFVDGVMEVHESRVTGKFIEFMKRTYSAVLDPEKQGDSNGIDQVSQDGDNTVGSEEVPSELAKEQPSPAAGSAINLSGNDNAPPRKKKQPAKRRNGPRSETAG